MKKKVLSIKKQLASSSKKTEKKIQNPPVSKVTVGEDEFCPTCMEWRAFDEITGKCCVCGHVIKKIGQARKITDEYDLKDFSNEHDEPPEPSEF
jgi:hypothetical protein